MGYGKGVYAWLTNCNHKAVGLRYIVTAFIFFVLSGILAIVHADAADAA